MIENTCPDCKAVTYDFDECDCVRGKIRADSFTGYYDIKGIVYLEGNELPIMQMPAQMAIELGKALANLGRAALPHAKDSKE